MENIALMRCTLFEYIQVSSIDFSIEKWESIDVLSRLLAQLEEEFILFAKLDVKPVVLRIIDKTEMTEQEIVQIKEKSLLALLQLLSGLFFKLKNEVGYTLPGIRDECWALVWKLLYRIE